MERVDGSTSDGVDLFVAEKSRRCLAADETSRWKNARPRKWCVWPKKRQRRVHGNSLERKGKGLGTDYWGASAVSTYRHRCVLRHRPWPLFCRPVAMALLSLCWLRRGELLHIPPLRVPHPSKLRSLSCRAMLATAKMQSKLSSPNWTFRNEARASRETGPSVRPPPWLR